MANNNLNRSRENEKDSVPWFKCASLSSHRRKIGIKANILFVQTFFQLPFFLFECAVDVVVSFFLWCGSSWLTQLFLFVQIERKLNCRSRLKRALSVQFAWNSTSLHCQNKMWCACLTNYKLDSGVCVCVFEFEFVPNEHKAGQINAIIANCMLAGVASQI